MANSDRKQGHVHEVSEAELREKLGEEKRTATRHSAKLEIEVPLASWDQVKRVFTTNISQGGLLFTLPSPASLAATVDLVLTLPNGGKVTLPCEVRHVSLREGTRDFDVGVQFSDIDPAARKTIEDALRQVTG
jgi:c-di-GMP-binding flagellar brake protein YcgR